MEKIKIEKDSVQETLIIPLYGRRLCSEIFPQLYQDRSAAEIMGKIDYDFTELERHSRSRMYVFGALEVAMRQNDIAWEIRNYLCRHPDAAVINLDVGWMIWGVSAIMGVAGFTISTFLMSSL